MTEPPKLAFDRPNITRQDFHRVAQDLMLKAQRSGEQDVAMRYLGEQSLFFFCVYILHMEYLDNDWGYALCHAVAEKKYGRMWILSREHFKSTVITIASTIREICMNPETTIAIYSYNQQTAQKLFFAPIKKELEENYLLNRLYPEVLWGDEAPGDIWQATQLNVKRKRRSKEATLQCASIFSQLTGYHCERLIYDDCSILEGVQTPDAIQTTCDAWDMTVNTGQSENLNICVIGTYYAFHELYEYIDKKGLVETIVQPCVAPDGRGVLWSDDVLKQKKMAMGSATFATQCLCDPKQGSSLGFKDEWLKFWTPSITAGLNIYIFVDPAGKVNRKRDRSVFWVIGLDAQDNYYVIDLIADRLNLISRVDTLFRLHMTYNPVNIFYEDSGLEGDIEAIRDRQEKTNYRFPITKINQTMEKGMRIEGLLPIFESGRIYLCDHAWHRNFSQVDEDMIQTFITEEYRAFPHLVHDDMLDDLANIVHPKVAPMLQRPDKWSLDRQVVEKMISRGFTDVPYSDSPSSDGLGDYSPF